MKRAVTGHNSQFNGLAQRDSVTPAVRLLWKWKSLITYFKKWPSHQHCKVQNGAQKKHGLSLVDSKIKKVSDHVATAYFNLIVLGKQN